MSVSSWSMRAAGSPRPTRTSRPSLRRQKKPVLLVANKCEGREAESQLSDAWSLGLGEPLPVSAEHGDGMPDLLLAIAPYLTEEPVAAAPVADEAAPVRPLRLAVIGRPNAGKSSLINRLIARSGC